MTTPASDAPAEAAAQAPPAEVAESIDYSNELASMTLDGEFDRPIPKHKMKKPPQFDYDSAKKEKKNNKNTQIKLLSSGEIWPHPVYYEGGLRRIKPYHWTYNTWVKERWRGRTIMEVFESEFRDRPKEYYQQCIDSGFVVVNGKPVTREHVLINGEMISHVTHRHEPPVTGDPIGIIHEDDDMIVLNKPAGIPVHAAGRYKYNTVLESMRFERGKDFLPYPCNRLDRLTSGIMFVAKNPKEAVKLGDQIMARTVRKEYIARVVGDFPEGEVVCNQPVLAISPKLGLNRVRASGKHAKTVFKKLAYYPPLTDSPRGDEQISPSLDDRGRPWKLKRGYSIVRCLPVTGRTHQLRVHLQFLGHPIQNDPIYANQRVWGLDLGASDADGTITSDDDVITRLSRMGKQEVAEAVEYYDEMVDEYEKKHAEKLTGETCDECDTPLYSDPGSHELRLYLHSLRYEDSGGEWAYVSELPSWALPPAGREGPRTVGGLDELVQAAKDEVVPEATMAEANKE